MGKVNYIKTNFSSGEISPRVFGRVDVSKYHNGCEKLENFIPKSITGAFRRPGLRYIANAKYNNRATRLIPFNFSTEQAYIIEVGDLYMRFYKDQGQIIKQIGAAWQALHAYVVGDIVTSSSAVYICKTAHTSSSTFGSDTANWTLQTPAWIGSGHSYVVGDYVLYSGSIYYCITAHSSSATFGADSSKWVAQVIYEIPTTYTKDEVFDIQFAQSSDVLYLAHPNHKPAKLERTSHTSWTLSDVTFTGGPYLPGGTDPAWTAALGYPGSVTFYEQRLAWAANYDQPQTVWLSKSQDYYNMTIGTNASDALIYQVATNDVNAIKWMYAVKVLLLGTASGIYSLSSGTTIEALTPTNVLVKRESNYGASSLLPAMIGNNTIFVERNLRSLRELIYSFSIDAYQAPDISILSEHITESGLVDTDYAQGPDNIYWAVRNDGQVCAVTRQIEQEVAAWARHITDGLFKSVAVIPGAPEDEVWFVIDRTINGSTVKYIEFLTPEDYGDNQEDAFFVDAGLSYDNPLNITNAANVAHTNIVTITSAGHGLTSGDLVKIRNVVGMTEINGYRYSISSVTTNTFNIIGLSTTGYSDYISGGQVRKCVTTISGLGHLEGEEVEILADGSAHPNRTVASGSITLDDHYSEIHVGLHYRSYLKIVRPEGGSRMGSSQGIIKRIYLATIRLYKSLGFQIGRDGIYDTAFFRTSAMPMDHPPELFTGDKQLAFPAGYDQSGQVEIIQDQPLPLNILAIILKTDVADE